MEHSTDIARRVFAFWKTTMGHTRGQLDSKRMNLICSRLNDGYSENDLMLAIFGCRHSRFHQGENDARKVYDSVELIFRNADKVDAFIRLGEQEQLRVERERQAKIAGDESRIAMSTTGPKYQEARKQLLSLVRKRQPGEDSEEAA